MNRRHILTGALCLALLAIGNTAAAAGSQYRHHSQQHGLRNHGHYHPQRLAPPTVGYTSPVRHLPGVGTFSRSVWAISGRADDDAPRRAPAATIIQVDESYFDRFDPCSYEERVCVIRGGR